MDIALEVAHRDGIQTGIEKGREEGRDYVLDLMAKGLSYEEIRKKIEENKKAQI